MELYDRPANRFVASFLGSANILDGGAGVAVPAGPAAGVPAAARERCRRSPAPTMGGPVTHREFLGATVRYGVRIGASEILVDAPFQSGAELRAIGETVGVALPPQRMLYLPA